MPSGGPATKELITILTGEWKVVGRETLCLEKLSGESRDDELMMNWKHSYSCITLMVFLSIYFPGSSGACCLNSCLYVLVLFPIEAI